MLDIGKVPGQFAVDLSMVREHLHRDSGVVGAEGTLAGVDAVIIYDVTRDTVSFEYEEALL